MSDEMQPAAWLYTDQDGGRVACPERIEPPFEGWTETPLYTFEQWKGFNRLASHPATSTPVVAHKQPETSDNDLVERVARAIEPQLAIDEALLASPQHLRKLKAHRVAQAAIAAIDPKQFAGGGNATGK